MRQQVCSADHVHHACSMLCGRAQHTSIIVVIFVSTFSLWLCSQSHTDYVPSIGLRFDYAQTGTDPAGAPVTPQVSVSHLLFVILLGDFNMTLSK